MTEVQTTYRPALPLAAAAIMYVKGYSQAEIARELHVSYHQARSLVCKAASIKSDPTFPHNIYTTGRNQGKKVPHASRQRVDYVALLHRNDNYLAYVEQCLSDHQHHILGHPYFELKDPERDRRGRYIISPIVPELLYTTRAWRGIPVSLLCMIMQHVMNPEGYVKSPEDLITLLPTIPNQRITIDRVKWACRILRLKHKKVRYVNSSKYSEGVQNKLRQFLTDNELREFPQRDIWYVDETSFTINDKPAEILYPVGADSPTTLVTMSSGNPRGRPRLQATESKSEPVQLGQRRSRSEHKSNRSDSDGYHISNEAWFDSLIHEDHSEGEALVLPRQEPCNLIRIGDDYSQRGIQDNGTWTVTTAMNATRGGFYMLTKRGANAEVFEKFLGKLRSAIGHTREIYMILDNASIHHTAKSDEAYVTHNITPAFIPPYYPELNAVEMVFSQWKQKFKRRKKFAKSMMHQDIQSTIQCTLINSSNLHNHVLNETVRFAQDLNMEVSDEDAYDFRRTSLRQRLEQAHSQ